MSFPTSIRFRGPFNRGVDAITRRFAGGGGRPGGRPAFNWKQKKMLGLNEARLKPFKLKPRYGVLEDILPYFDSSRGDMIVDITDLEKWEEPPNPYKNMEEENSKKKINSSRLFGSSKPCGLLPDKGRNKYRGPAYLKRVFPKEKKKKNYSNSADLGERS